MILEWLSLIWWIIVCIVSPFIIIKMNGRG